MRSAEFQREDVELAKPFLVWHVTETFARHWTPSSWLISALSAGALALGKGNSLNLHHFTKELIYLFYLIQKVYLKNFYVCVCVSGVRYQ